MSDAIRDQETTISVEEAPRHAAGEAVPPTLTIAYSPDAGARGRTISLGSDLVPVGRDVVPEAGKIRDLRLSRLHFRIAFDGRARRHLIGDAKSRNGVLINGAMHRSAPLNRGDVIRAGDTVFVYDTPSPMAALWERVEKIAPTSLTVLITGETGSGKERIARSIHEESGRSGDLVALNCAGIPHNLIAAELFGHTRGAFSGAAQPRAGLFVAAAGGTLFLDEIGELPLDQQAVLLRAIQERRVRALGADEEIAIDTRVIAATHADLARAVEAGRFRADLHARLCQTTLAVPSVRDRRAEIVSLVEELAESEPPVLTADAAEALARHDWPYNVRELQSLVLTHGATHPDAPIDLQYLGSEHPQLVAGFRAFGTGRAAASETGSTNGDISDRKHLEALLSKHGGNVSAVAEELDKTRAQIYRWMKAAGLSARSFR